MEITNREFWTLIHGMVLGAIFLLAFGGGLAGLYSLRPEFVTTTGVTERLGRLKIGTVIMAVVAWLTVMVGTWIVYPWYRAPAPKGATAAALLDFPKFFLLSSTTTAEWHNFGMEWKEHIGWLAPILITAVAYVVVRYGGRLARQRDIRSAAMTFLILAFAAAAVAGIFGALITKAAPVH